MRGPALKEVTGALDQPVGASLLPTFQGSWWVCKAGSLRRKAGGDQAAVL